MMWLRARGDGKVNVQVKKENICFTEEDGEDSKQKTLSTWLSTRISTHIITRVVGFWLYT
jgi:hypothetical protein